MTLFERYLRGEQAEVYAELYSMGEDALSQSNFIQTDLILKETFNRVKYNLEVIYNELKQLDYRFYSETEIQKLPLVPPETDIDKQLVDFKARIANEKNLPLSLEYFYRIVGTCNFCWNWIKNPEIPWEGSDPLEIPPVSFLNECISDNYDSSDILLSGDYLQKDNISGSCYKLQLTSELQIDSLLLHECWDIPFIEYLRITIFNCGFSMADQVGDSDLDSFCTRVRPLLQKI